MLTILITVSYQKLYFDKEINLKKVEVYDTSDTVKITFNINSIDYKANLEDNYFDMNAGEYRVKILDGKPDGLKVRSVYDI